MPVTIEVYRGAGDRPGDEISEPLLGDSLEAALARGRAELDENAHGWERVTLEVDYGPNIRLGELVEVDPVSGTRWNAIITGIAHRLDSGVILTTLDVRRPTD